MQYGKFDVYAKDTSVGEIEITEEGIRNGVKCYAEYESDEVLRLAADVGGRYECLGVMMPCGKGFSFKKIFTKNETYEKSLDKAVKYVLICENEQYKEERKEDDRVWSRCGNPAALFEDFEVGSALSRFEGVLKAEENGVTYIAVPAEKPFPPLPIFYFGQMENLGGSEYMVFSLKNGQLLI